MPILISSPISLSFFRFHASHACQRRCYFASSPPSFSAPAEHDEFFDATADIFASPAAFDARHFASSGFQPTDTVSADSYVHYFADAAFTPPPDADTLPMPFSRFRLS
jgi:hypothetical protein